MKLTLLLRIVLIPLFITFFINSPLTKEEGTTPTTDFAQVAVSDPKNRKVEILSAYLAQKNSPLTQYAPDFIEAADTYGLDWKLVPAISGVESTFGKQIPGGHNPQTISYNAWGWGVYGDQSLGFSSWRDGIFTVTEGLKHRYVDKGLTDPYSMNRVYASSPAWGGHVAYFLDDLSKFEAQYNKPTTHTDMYLEVGSKTSGPSGQLALR